MIAAKLFVPIIFLIGVLSFIPIGAKQSTASFNSQYTATIYLGTLLAHSWQTEGLKELQEVLGLLYIAVEGVSLNELTVYSERITGKLYYIFWLWKMHEEEMKDHENVSYFVSLIDQIEAAYVALSAQYEIIFGECNSILLNKIRHLLENHW